MSPTPFLFKVQQETCGGVAPSLGKKVVFLIKKKT